MFIERITPIRYKRRLLAKILTIIIILLTKISITRDASIAIINYIL